MTFPSASRPSTIAATCAPHGVGIVEKIKPAIAILLEIEPHLPNDGPDFGRLNAAAIAEPSLQGPCRRLARLALAPARQIERDCELARPRKQSEPVRDPFHLAVRPGRAFVPNEAGDHLANVIAIHAFG